MSEKARTEYYSWLVIPLRVCDPATNAAYFKRENIYELDLPDLTFQAQNMFGNQKGAIGNCWRIDEKDFMKEVFGTDLVKTFTVANATYRDDELEFRMYTSWMFSFHSGISFLCLGICHEDPLVVMMLSDFGYLKASAVVNLNKSRILFQEAIFDWMKNKLGCAPFLANESAGKSKGQLFVDACIFNLALEEERFANVDSLKKAVHNLHLGLRVEDSRTDTSEEDIRYVLSVKNLEVDAPGFPGEGSHRWGCCITSQTLNFLYGGFDFKDPNKDETIDEILMEGLPLMILALHQRYRCFELLEQMNTFYELSSEERDKLRDTVTKFIVYDTLSASAISRWYNVKQVYSHLINLLDTTSSIEDVTRKLNMLIEESEKHAKEAVEKTNSLITLFGAFAIPASAIEIIDLLLGDKPLWQKSCIGIIFAILMGVYFHSRKK